MIDSVADKHCVTKNAMKEPFPAQMQLAMFGKVAKLWSIFAFSNVISLLDMHPVKPCLKFIISQFSSCV